MQKEVILAILVGFVVGLFVTFGIWKANKAIKTSTTPGQEVKTEIVEEISPTLEILKPLLTILSPNNELLSKESKVTLKGTFLPSSPLAVISEKGEKFLEADADGNFETEIDLILGENVIEVSGFSKNGEEAKQILTVVYSTAEI